MNHAPRIALAPLYAAFFTFAVTMAACQSRQPAQTAPSTQSAQNSASSPGTLKIVNGPNGGQLAYGSLTGNGTLRDAMIYMLRDIHNYFGDRPQVGKFFESRDKNSLATFFTLTAKGNLPMAGLVIVTMHGQNPPQVAVLYDKTDRFTSSEPSLMKTLTAAQGASLSSSGGSNGAQASSQAPAAAPLPRGGPEPLTMVTGGDRSAAIGLPAGWRLTSVQAGGHLSATGPRGEMVEMSVLYQQIVDPTRQYGAGMPGFNNGSRLVCPYTRDLYSAWVSVSNQVRRMKGLPPATYTLISQQNLPASPGVQILPVQAFYTVDFHDGVGTRKGSAGIFPYSPAGSPLWAMNVSSSNIPEKYADAEQATMLAIVKSFTPDANVIASQARADVIRIQQVGEMVKANVAAADARREASAQSFNNHMQQIDQNASDFDRHNAEIDWQSKINQDYILDRSVIRDTADTAHGTFGNNLADTLVRSNPNQLEYVPNQELVRGTDY